jgi:hypothetical protein
MSASQLRVPDSAARQQRSVLTAPWPLIITNQQTTPQEHHELPALTEKGVNPEGR